MRWPCCARAVPRTRSASSAYTVTLAGATTATTRGSPTARSSAARPASRRCGEVAEDRYARHALIPDWSQPALSAASVVIVGVGAVGSEVARLLAQAGVGRLLLCDPDTIEESNLSRGALYGPADLGRPKAEAAADALRARDRKSTRLNSSHSQISYAVFCLKKKKTKHAYKHLHTKNKQKR